MLRQYVCIQWSWSCGSWIYNYLCNQCLSPLKLVGFTTTYAISAYHHQRCEFESRSGKMYLIQHYVIKFVSDFVAGHWFFPGTLVSSTNKTDLPRYSGNIVDSGVKHNYPNSLPNLHVLKKNCIFMDA